MQSGCMSAAWSISAAIACGSARAFIFRIQYWWLRSMYARKANRGGRTLVAVSEHSNVRWCASESSTGSPRPCSWCAGQNGGDVASSL